MFKVHGGQQSSGGSTSEKTIDFKAMNEYVIATAKLEDRETLVGHISQIVDLGTQKLPDAESVFKGDAKEEADIIAKQPETYFKDGFDWETKQKARFKCYPQKDQPCVAFAVDFPDIMVDKGQFFGEAKPLPLRLWMGGQFYTQESGMVIGRPTPLKYTNLDKSRKTKVWSMALNSLPYKMAVAAKLVKSGEPFLPERIDELLGKSFQFAAQLWMKNSKSGEEYYTEYVNFVGALGRGQEECKHFTTPQLVHFEADNSEESIKEIRAHIINTIKRATNYAGSNIEAQIDKYRFSKDNKPSTPKVESKPAVQHNAIDDYEFDEFDDDIPF
jgi:hypothetical protein